MRLAVIGDVHTLWTADDVSWFDGSDTDAVLFVGDFPGLLHRQTLQVARAISRLQTPAIALPGNHDGTHPLQVLAEALRRGHGTDRWAAAQTRQVEALRTALGGVQLGGYSVHPLGGTDGGIDLIAARPHAMDGRFASFAPYLAARFGVRSLADSAERLRRCVDRCTRPIVFLAHNGPAGLGHTRDDLFGLSRPERDNGDSDLRDAIRHARDTGRQVLAVVAGHMHHTGDGGMRRWILRHDDVLYVNAARVPRIFSRRGRRWRHHVQLDIGHGGAMAREVPVPG